MWVPVAVWKPCKLLYTCYLLLTTTTTLHLFNGLLSRTTWVSRYQKGKTSMDLNQARDDGVWEWQSDHMLDTSWTTCNLHLAPDRQSHQHLLTQLLQAACSSWCPTIKFTFLAVGPTHARKFFFALRVIHPWNSLKLKPASMSSLCRFKALLRNAELSRFLHYS